MTDQWRVDVEKRITKLEQRDAVDQVHRDNMSGKLTKIEDTLTWLVRLVIGALLLAAIAFVVQGGIAK